MDGLLTSKLSRGVRRDTRHVTRARGTAHFCLFSRERTTTIVISIIMSDECRTFEDIYANGEALCNTMFGDAFVYTTEESEAYTMWFFDEGNNPNHGITETLNATNSSLFESYDMSTCNLRYNHKEEPSAESDNFTECHPWKESSCCHQNTVKDVDTINNLYGPEYRWDRCGEMSQACERFFVQEACFYECDLNTGLWRKYAPHVFNSSDENHNLWEVYRMPIKASYCDAWFSACRNDYFCGGGNYFECGTYDTLPFMNRFDIL